MRYGSIIFLLLVVAACGSTVPLNAPGPNAIAGATEDARQMTQQAYADQDRVAQQTQAAANAIVQQAAQAQALQATADSQRSTAAADNAIAAAMQANAVLTQSASYVRATQMYDLATATVVVATQAAAVDMQATAKAIADADRDADRKAALTDALYVGSGILFVVIAIIISVALGWVLIGVAKAQAEKAQARAEQEKHKAEQEKAKADQEKAKALRDGVLEYDSILFDLSTKRIVYQPRSLPAAMVVEPGAPKAPELYQPRGLSETEDDGETGETRADVLKERLITFLEFAAGVYGQEGKAAGKGEGRDKDGRDIWDATVIPSAGKMLKTWGYGNESWQLRKNFFARFGWLEASPAGTAITNGRTLRDMVQWVSGLGEEFLEAYLVERDAAQKVTIIGAPLMVPYPTGN